MCRLWPGGKGALPRRRDGRRAIRLLTERWSGGRPGRWLWPTMRETGRRPCCSICSGEPDWRVWEASGLCGDRWCGRCWDWSGERSKPIWSSGGFPIAGTAPMSRTPIPAIGSGDIFCPMRNRKSVWAPRPIYAALRIFSWKLRIIWKNRSGRREGCVWPGKGRSGWLSAALLSESCIPLCKKGCSCPR